MSVTYMDVDQAILLLLEHKKPLTLANLRVELGNRGSMSTLTKYLQQWKAQRYIDSSKIATPIVPPAPDAIFSAVQTVWQQMQGLGDQKFSEKEKIFEEDRLAWSEDRAALEQDLLQKTQECDACSQALLETRYERDSWIAKYDELSEQQVLLQQRFDDRVQFQIDHNALYEKSTVILKAQYEALVILHQSVTEKHLNDLAAQKESFEHTQVQSRSQHQMEYESLMKLYQEEQTQGALTLQNLQQQKSFEQSLKQCTDLITKHSSHIAQTLSKMTEELDTLKIQGERSKHNPIGYASFTLTLSSDPSQ